MMKEQWNSRTGFVLAAIGSAIGLGNIWRFPYVTYENGGGAFLIPYLVAMLVLGIPFIILQLSIGHKYRAGAPHAFFKANKNFTWLGWVESLLASVIAVYYVVIIGWAISYFFFSFHLSWGADTNHFFSSVYLNSGNHSPLSLGSIQGHLILPLVAAWFLTFICLFFGVGKGIERISRVMMPLLFILTIVLVIRTVTLPGASSGLNWLFQPNFSKLTDPHVWLAAFGQVFFSLSLGFGIMVAYASYLPKKSDITNNAMITAFINCGFSLLAGIIIFSVLGNMSFEQGIPLTKVVSAGVGLTFITIPEAFDKMPMAHVIAPLFFLSLIFAGASSHMSLVESVVRAFTDKLGWPRKVMVSVICGAGCCISLLFITNGGLTLLDLVDHFANEIILISTCTLELILFGWFFKLQDLRSHCNVRSDFSLGNWWIFALKYMGIIILGYLLIQNLITDFSTPYGGYSESAIIIVGWGMTVCIFVAAILLSLHKNWHEKEQPIGA